MERKTRALRQRAALATLVLVLGGWSDPRGHPFETSITGGVAVENWRQSQPYSLRSFHRISRDFIAVNAEEVRVLKVGLEEDLYRLPSVARLIAHPALDALLVVQDGTILVEHYANGVTPTTYHACMSTTKPMVNLLAGKADDDGEIDLAAKVEEYVPEIGSGFRGRSVANVLAMSVRHELDYSKLGKDCGKECEKVRRLFDKEESTMGWQPSRITSMTRREFLASLEGGNDDGSNTNREKAFLYASANTDLGGWILERATQVPAERAVRRLLHAIGGENTVYLATDRTGVPIVGAGLVITPRDFARYGMLLGSGGVGVDGQLVGGGPEFVQKTMGEGEVVVHQRDDGTWYYINSAYANKRGIGHPGLGGQLIWADPQSKTVIAAFSGRSSSSDEVRYYHKLFDMVVEVVDHNRGNASRNNQ